MATSVPRPRFSGKLIAERDALEQDILNNNAAIARWTVSPRWNWRELEAARVVQRRFEREVIFLTIEIDIALERELNNLTWLMAQSQEELRARIDAAWRAAYSR